MSTHFVGVGGIGMSALAHILLDLKTAPITGSDRCWSATMQALSLRGAQLSEGHDEKLIREDCTRLCVSSAIASDHEECQEARCRGIPILHRSELLATLMEGFEPLLVTGTHGKTTTSCLLSWVLYSAGWDPTWALGGLFQSGMDSVLPHGRLGRGLYFVAEADESDGTFLNYPARAAIVTNCDRDHLDHFGTEQALENAFSRFCQRVPAESCFWCCDDPGLQRLQPRGISYGQSPDAMWRLDNPTSTADGLLFSVHGPHHCLTDLQLPLFGLHNALNATAVVALCLHLGLPEALLRQGLNTFPGVQRRCHIECQKPYTVLHDYGHHPTEIRVTLDALRAQYAERRLVVAFQPHRYTRTAHLLEQFGSAFGQADHILVTDVYAAGERPIPGVDGAALCAAIERAQEAVQQQVSIDYARVEHLSQRLLQLLTPGDVLVCFGAGSIDAVAREIAHIARSST